MASSGTLIRFGVFEADLRSGELRKQGSKVKLRDQPFLVLAALLEHPGEVVTRDEIQAKLWPSDTFVDFDRGLNKAITYLRDALGDSAESPRFIETLPKRGYRFIAPIDAGPPNGDVVLPMAEPAQPEVRRRVLTALPWAIAVVSSVIAVIAVALLWRATRPPDRPLIRFSVDLGPQAIRGLSTSGSTFAPEISPDGTRLVFPVRAADGTQQLATRRLDQPMVTILAGTEGGFDPFFSPDGQWIGFFSGKKLKKIPVQGGEVVSLSDTTGVPRGASWGDDGTIIANLDLFHLSQLPAAGGEPKVIGKPEEHGERTWRWPQVLPGGENILFTGLVAASAAAVDSANIEVLSLKSGRVKVVQRGGNFGRYLASGHLVYFRQGTMYGVPFDLGHLETRGEPVPLLEDVADSGGSPSTVVSVSTTGTLLYSSAAQRIAPLAWLDSAGKSQPVFNSSPNSSKEMPGQVETPRLSPDGNRLAFSAAGDLFVHDLQRGTASRLTYDSALNRHGVWASDAQHIVYSSDVPSRDGEFGIWWTRSDGSGQPQKLFSERTPLQPFSISPDGRILAFVRTGEGLSFEVWMLPLDLADANHPKPGQPEPLADESKGQFDPAFSPDGRWVAYVSTAGSGARLGTVSIRPFPSARSAAEWQVSESGGKFPVWSRNGRELFYLSADNRIMVVRYTTSGSTFVPQKPQPWSPAPLFRPTNNGFWNFDVAPDGRRFVVLAPPEPSKDEPATVHATVLLNFFDELRRTLPPI